MATTLLTLLACLAIIGVYLLFRPINKKNYANSTCAPLDQSYVYEALTRIYQSPNSEHLEDTFGAMVRHLPKYHALLRLAKEERERELMGREAPISFTQQESRVRKQWKISFFMTYFTTWLLFTFALILQTTPLVAPNLVTIFYLTLFSTTFMGLNMWLLYHCAYRKKGTKLLTWIIFLLPVQSLGAFIKEGLDPSLWYIVLPLFVICGFYWFSCLQLKNMNYIARANSQLTHFKTNNLAATT